MRLFTAGILIFLFSGLNSCDNSEELGLGLTPPGERFAYHMDSETTISMNTLRQDSLTSEKRNPVLLGSVQDDVYGAYQAGILTQLRLSSNNVNFGEDVQLDSAVLMLKYMGYHGDTTQLQHLRIFELEQDLYFDSTYYSNLAIEEYFDAQKAIGEKSFYPAPTTDSLTIRLNDEAGLKILQADTSHLKDPASFLEFFRGLYLQTDPLTSGGAISYFNFAGGKSRLTLYYSNAEADSLSYEILINTNSAWVNVFSHDYAGSEVEPFVNDSVNSHPRVFIQGVSGLRAGMALQFSDSLLARAERGIAINKAELILPVDPSYINEIRLKPVSLALYGATADGTNQFIEDIFLGESYYDGGYHPEEDAYKFNIALHVQGLIHPDSLKRTENRGLFLVIGDGRTSAGNLVLKNGTGMEGARLNITYTMIQ